MTKEEKDAIEIYEEDIRIAREYYENEEDFKADGEYNKVILLNLIEKLQKENEELKKQKVEYLDKIDNKIDNLKYEYKKAAKHFDLERASFYRDLIRHFEILLEEE